MSTKAESYLQALLALSGKPDLANARKNLLRDVGNRDLLDNIIQGTQRAFPREELEEVAVKMLDNIERRGFTAGQQDDRTASCQDRKHKGHETKDCAVPAGPASRGADVPIGIAQLQSQHTCMLASSYVRSELTVPFQKIKIDENDSSGDGKIHAVFSSAVSKVKKPNRELAMPTINIVLWLPITDDNSSWISLEKDSLLLRTQVREKLESEYSAKPYLHKKLGQLLRNLDKHLSYGHCVHRHMNSRAKGPCEYNKAGSIKERACDLCIKMHRFCFRPARVDGTMKLALYPLPSSHRHRRDWKEIEFWFYT
ncbi:hypothetical protein T440DRAFT_526784 [Plenodomus tracheiphilus IPT5]|uniref:Uncharacterized protein n=1 Tax=Plenodomus tracheiphilus IPT5 TaxID=1408161 RepID=A0A6A7BBX5_9PLEO|nr:hypothetical protein T440DRAFT_526784 [Plenodomus tracheiphilus IPT5]